MKKLHENYKQYSDYTRHCHKLKLQLKETFSEKISFFRPNNRCPEIVIASNSIEEVLTTIARPIKSAAGAEEIILTCFLVDNFDIKVERLCGSSVVNTTHLMHSKIPT